MLYTESGLIAIKKALKNNKTSIEYQRVLKKHHLKCNMTQIKTCIKMQLQKELMVF